MDNLNPDLPASFIFKMPTGISDSNNIDLKWLGEQFEMISELLNKFLDNYKELSSSQNHPPELLKSQFQVISALANYQINLIEQQRRRQGFIQNESELHEMMNQIEGFIKTFRDKEK